MIATITPEPDISIEDIIGIIIIGTIMQPSVEFMAKIDMTNMQNAIKIPPARPSLFESTII